jgi:ABC-type sugar transport system ATPase subunit
VKEQRKVIELIKQLRDNYNVSIIVISHNLYHVFELVDRIVVLRNGRIIGEKIKSETTQNEVVSMITGVAV